jgi:HSP20 family molecular chaperone IbpA
MSVVEKAQIAYRPIDGVDWLTSQLNDRIRRKAFAYYLDRGSIDGHDLEDWLRAESALVIRPNTAVKRIADEFIVDVELPGADPDEIMLFVGTREIAVSTKPEDDGRQVCRLIQLPEPIEVHNVDAEFGDGELRITAPFRDTGE